MKPHLVIDARMVGAIPHGIARYVTELSQGLSLLNLNYEPIFLVRSEDYSKLFYPFRTVVVSVPFLNPKEIFELPRILRNLQARLYHSPSFSSLWNCPCPSIVTIHDLNHLTFGSWTQKLYYQTVLRRFAKQSKVIVTVSEFSRHELSIWLNIPEKEIEIVYNSVSINLEKLDPPSAEKEVLRKFGLEPGKYFFCLSNSKPHKNLSLLMNAYSIFKKQCASPWPLVLTIDPSQPIEGVKTIGAQTESTVGTLLANSGGGLFPSLYEGFGLPPVEAAIYGSPLAVSQIAPHQEGLRDLQGGEVLWVAPKDLHGWVNAFHRLFRGEISSTSMTTRRAILERYHFGKMAQNMDRIYQHVLRLKP